MDGRMAWVCGHRSHPQSVHEGYVIMQQRRKQGAGPVQKKRYLYDRDGGLPGGSQPGTAAEDIKEQLDDGEVDAQT